MRGGSGGTLTGAAYVLIVDDDPAMADMYRFGLEGQGFRVEVLSSARTLNQAIEAEPPDAVILDWDLPGIRGDEALERLRETSHGRHLPVLFLSNFPGNRDGRIDRVFHSGALAWLEKINTTPTQLAQKVSEALGLPPSPGGGGRRV